MWEESVGEWGPRLLEALSGLEDPGESGILCRRFWPWRFAPCWAAPAVCTPSPLVYLFDSLGPTGHLRHIFYHTNHRITSPALDCLDSTRLCSATVVLSNGHFC